MQINFVPLFGPCFPVSLCALLYFVVFSAAKEIATSPSLYGLPLYKGRCSLINLVRESGGPLNLFWGCVFSGIVYVISQRACQLFRSLQSLSPSGVCLRYCRFSGVNKPLSSLVLCSLLTSKVCWFCYCFKSRETETNP